MCCVALNPAFGQRTRLRAPRRPFAVSAFCSLAAFRPRSVKALVFGSIQMLSPLKPRSRRRGICTTQALFEKFTEPALHSVLEAQKAAQRFQAPEVIAL